MRQGMKRSMELSGLEKVTGYAMLSSFKLYISTQISHSSSKSHWHLTGFAAGITCALLMVSESREKDPDLYCCCCRLNESRC